MENDTATLVQHLANRQRPPLWFGGAQQPALMEALVQRAWCKRERFTAVSCHPLRGRVARLWF
jgi:hypothetical protein